MTPAARLLRLAGTALLACLAPVPGLGAEESGSVVDSAPSLELLEFLGQWETDAGLWINPELLGDPQLGMLMGMMGPEQTDASQDEPVIESDNQDE